MLQTWFLALALANPLFDELRDPGVVLGPNQRAPLPAPTIAAGLTGAEQKAALEKLLADAYPLEDFTRDSFVAPAYWKFRDVKTTDPNNPAFGIDLWFVAHGDFNKLSQRDPQKMFFVGRQQDIQIQTLSPEELKDRKLAVAGKDEQILHVAYPLFDKVQVSLTTRTLVTREKDRILVAQKLESALNDDAKYPNRWQLLKEAAGGKLEPAGPTHRYEGLGMYFQLTPLIEPAGAIFVEFHQVAVEPKAWFDGENILRSKLPLLLTTEVRAFRRELKKIQ